MKVESSRVSAAEWGRGRSLADGIQLLLVSGVGPVHRVIAPSTVWTHSLLAAQGTRAAVQPGRRQRSNGPAGTGSPALMVITADRPGTGWRGSGGGTEGVTQRSAKAPMRMKTNEKPAVRGFSLRQNAAVSRKGWEMCRVDVG